MLAKKYKLPVDEFIKKRPVKSYRFDFFGVKINKNILPYSRFGIVISKKVFASAVKRNKIKREVFDLIRKEEFYKIPQYDVLLIIVPGAANINKNQIENALRETLSGILLK